MIDLEVEERFHALVRPHVVEILELIEKDCAQKISTASELIVGTINTGTTKLFRNYDGLVQRQLSEVMASISALKLCVPATETIEPRNGEASRVSHAHTHATASRPTEPSCSEVDALSSADDAAIVTEPLSPEVVFTAADVVAHTIDAPCSSKAFWAHMDSLYVRAAPRLWCCFEYLEEEKLFGSDDDLLPTVYDQHSLSDNEHALHEACASVVWA